VNKAEQFKIASSKAKYPHCLTDYSVEELKRFDLILSPDSSFGCAITPDKELVNLFNINGDGQGRYLALIAVNLGAKKLNCFDGFLKSYYELIGFVETSRVQFDDSLAPDNWDYETNGRPDVVHMEIIRYKNQSDGF
jgi:hypothetical protein